MHLTLPVAAESGDVREQERVYECMEVPQLKLGPTSALETSISNTWRRLEETPDRYLK